MSGPFDVTGTIRGADGRLRYQELPESLIAVLDRERRTHPERESVVEFRGERLTYAALWERAGEVAGGLRQLGVEPGDRVALRLPNGLNWVLGYLGALFAGAIVVPVNTRFCDQEVDYVVANSGAKLVLDERSPLPSGPHTVENRRPDSVVSIFYTSGTTGYPKGAMLTNEGILTNSENTRRFMTPDMGHDAMNELRTLIAVPLFHVTGCHMQLVTSLYLGGTAVIVPRFTPGDFLAALAGERISSTVSAPAIYAMVMDDPAFADTDLSSLRTLYYGGAPTTPAQIRRIREGFPGVRVGNGFGLTESTGVLTLLPHEETEKFTDSVGYPMPSNELRIDQPDARTATGELLARGPNLMIGYWQNPESTAEAIVDGWLRTGDIARIDQAGRVYIVDRVKDMINRGGENVYCSEVENALAAIEGIAEVAVVGVPEPKMGERVGAVVVPCPGSNLDAQEIISQVRTRIADFKVPEYLLVSQEPLPRNAAGKVLKRDLRGSDWTNATWTRAVAG